MHLKGTPCRVFINDIKLRVARDKAHYYPDLIVTCDARHTELTGDVGWEKLIHEPGDAIELTSVSLTLSMDDIYDDTDL